MNTIELNQKIDLLKVCRLCLNQNKELIPVFTTSNFEIQYSIIISECTGVTISESDELPKRICLGCVECLNNFYEFRKLVVHSEHRLYDFLNKYLNNLNKDVMNESTNIIKQENLTIDSNEEPICPNKSIENQYNLPQDLGIKSEIEFIEEKFKISENETLTETASIISNSEEKDKRTAFNIESIFKCKSCPESFVKKTDLKNHEKIHQKIDLLNSASSGHVARRKKSNKNKKSYNCKFCPKTFIQSSDLKRHERIHTGEKRYNCDQCEKSFSHSCDLKRHEKIHTGETPFVCKQCNKVFSVKFHLKNHERIHSGERPFKCDQCEKSFAQLSNLKTHQKIHNGEKSCICDQCGKSFTQSVNLTKHKRIHKGEKPFVCDRCGKSFVDSSHLKRHQQIHTGERPYSCKQCGKSFTNMSYLRKHEKFHRGEKTHICDQCGKSFFDTSDLKKHKRIHTGEKPYSCDQCGKCFVNASHLKRHKLIHTAATVIDSVRNKRSNVIT